MHLESYNLCVTVSLLLFDYQKLLEKVRFYFVCLSVMSSTYLIPDRVKITITSFPVFFCVL